MKNKVAGFAFFILFHTFCAAQSPSLTLPFRVINKLILLEATVDGQPGSFILDTGVEMLVLNNRYFTGEPTNRHLMSINGQRQPIQETKVACVIGDWRLLNVTAEVTDMKAVEQFTGMPVHGCIGTGLFRDVELVIDYVFNEITMYQLDRSGRPLTPRSIFGEPVDVLSFKYKGSIPALEAQLGERELRFGLDTGAGVNLLSPRSIAEPLSYFTRLEPVSVAGFGNQAREMSSGPLEGLIVGKQNCPPFPTVLQSLDDLNRELIGCKLDGILGFPFLSQYRTAINFRTREIRLWSPNEVRQQYLAYLNSNGKREKSN